jgi:hypothetical protein
MNRMKLKQLREWKKKQGPPKARVAAALGLALGLIAASPVLSAGVCPGMRDVSIYVLDTNSTLYRWSPGATAFETLGRVKGTGAENLIGMDFRPADGQLYAFGDRNTVFRLRPDAVTPDGVPADTISSLRTSFISIFGGGLQSLMDFNPVVDAIRVIGSNRSNYAITSANGGLFNQFTRQTDMNIMSGTLTARGTPNITAGAYDNNYTGATNTTFYMIDHENDNFAMVPLAANGSGSSNTAGGVVAYYGGIFDPGPPNPLTPPINFTPVAGLDVYTDTMDSTFPNFGVATNGSSLYCIGVQSPKIPGGGTVVSYDLNTLKRLVTMPSFIRMIATRAAVTDVPGGVTLADVAVAPW